MTHAYQEIYLSKAQSVLGDVFDYAINTCRISGVSLRSIQMYEQRNKNINKANADTVYQLAKALGCTMEDLIEK